MQRPPRSRSTNAPIFKFPTGIDRRTIQAPVARAMRESARVWAMG